MDCKALSKFFYKLDRAFFIDNENKEWANQDQALSIGYEQTISQPSLVLEMTSQLAPEKSSKVLEIGTGSGYQTALLAEFSGMVYTIERIPELAEKAKVKLEALGYSNIVYQTGDGSEGWQENGPFDRIIVTAAVGKIPLELIDQLKAEGRMIIPFGPQGLQDLLLITKDVNGQVHTVFLEKVIFVEFKGKYGWKDKDRY
jgi:protein-L-isoaspartate(D-aspartate) O-methyltransferase